VSLLASTGNSESSFPVRRVGKLETELLLKEGDVYALPEVQGKGVLNVQVKITCTGVSPLPCRLLPQLCVAPVYYSSRKTHNSNGFPGLLCSEPGFIPPHMNACIKDSIHLHLKLGRFRVIRWSVKQRDF